jgi:ABC-type glycerol-3-phosphate transport system substrate-binding protein
MPDVALFGAAQVPAVADAKLVLPLDSRISAWGHLGDFVPASLVSSQWAGKQWGLPLAVEVRLHLWRKSILENAGIDRVPATWDEMTEAIRRSMLVERGTIVRDGYPRPDGWTGFAAALLTLGKGFFGHAAPAPTPTSGATPGPGGPGGTAGTSGITALTPTPAGAQVDLTGPEGVAALNHLLAVYRATRPAGVAPSRSRAAAYPFAAGTLAHTVDNATTLRALEQTYPDEVNDVVVGDPPVPPPGVLPGSGGQAASAGQVGQSGTAKVRPVTLLSAEWLGVAASSPSQDQAWALVQYLLEPASLLAVNETRAYRPPRKSLSTARFLRQPQLERMVELADRYGQPLPRVPEQKYFQDTLRAMADELFTGRSTVEQALSVATRQLQHETDRLGITGFGAAEPTF